MLGYLKWNFVLAPSWLKLLLCTSLISTKIEYASVIRDPSHNSLIILLKGAQNRSAHFILSNYHCTASTISMKAFTYLILPLAGSYLVSYLFHKIYHHTIWHNKLMTQPVYVSSLVDHIHKVDIPSSITIMCWNSGFPVPPVNGITFPLTLLQYPGVSFKNVISNHIFTCNFTTCWLNVPLLFC